MARRSDRRIMIDVGAQSSAVVGARGLARVVVGRRLAAGFGVFARGRSMCAVSEAALEIGEAIEDVVERVGSQRVRGVRDRGDARDRAAQPVVCPREGNARGFAKPAPVLSFFLEKSLLGERDHSARDSRKKKKKKKKKKKTKKTKKTLQREEQIRMEKKTRGSGGRGGLAQVCAEALDLERGATSLLGQRLARRGPFASGALVLRPLERQLAPERLAPE